MQPLACVTRGKRVESVHAGCLCVAQNDGRIVHVIGQPTTPLFLRSTAKPLQALALVATGAAARFGLNAAELAIICGSHSGEAYHRQAVTTILQKAGLKPEQLECGAADPYNPDALHGLWERRGKPDVLCNCCSGKHAGMLLLSAHLGVNPEGYRRPQHPVQVQIRRTIGQALGLPRDQLMYSTDDCGTPALLLTMQQAAAAYASLVTGTFSDQQLSVAGRQIVIAMLAHPEMVNGTGEFCTELMRHTAGQVLGKVGGEGVYMVGLPSLGLGISLKVADGNERAVYPIIVAALKELQVLTREQLHQLGKWAEPPVRDHHGEQVGSILPLLRDGFAIRSVGLGEEIN